MEPILPNMNGIVIPCIVLFSIALELFDFELFVCVVEFCVEFDIADDGEEESKANTNDAGRNTLQHQSYK